MNHQRHDMLPIGGFANAAQLSIKALRLYDQLGKHIGDSLKRLFALVEEQGITMAGAPLGIYHGPVNHDADGPIEVCLPLQGQIAVTGDIAARELAGGTVASVMLHGGQCEFPEILKGYDAVYDWIRQNGYQPAESPREIWHSEPGQDARMEVAWPFKEAGA